MTTQHLLLVDGDPRSLRTLEASLRGAGFAVSTAVGGDDALARCRVSAPDLVISDTEMPGMDGFQLCRELQDDDRLRETAFIFLTARGSVEEKVRGLELGVEDYLTKPIDGRELVTRIRLAIEKKEKERLLRREQRASISGSLADMPIVDLVQTLEIGRKSGTVRVEDPEGRSGTLWLRDGAVVDAAAGRLRGEPAFHRLVRWREGRFAIDFGRPDRPARIGTSTTHLLLEGMRRLDEWTRTLQRLPPLGTPLQIDYLALSDRLAEIPDDLNAILKLVDGRRTLAQVIEETEHDDLVTASTLEVFVRERILQVRAPRADDVARAPRSPPALPGPPPAEAAPPERVDWFAGPTPTAPLPPVLAPTSRPAPAGVAAEPEPPPPRIVRFAAKPKPPAGAPPVEVAPAAMPAAPVPAPELPPPRPSTVAPWVAVAAALAVAVGIGAWALTTTRAAHPAASGDPGPSGGYDVALAEARRQHAAAHPADAVAQYRAAIASRETSEALEGLGRALAETGDRVGAVEALRRAIEVDPSGAAAYMALARIYRDAKRPDEARTAYQRYLALDPRGSHADEARAALAASAE